MTGSPWCTHRGSIRSGQATHKIALRSVADVDDEILHLLREAYEQSPPA
jgi:hypothetical protein